jgi:hypothetical protein
VAQVFWFGVSVLIHVFLGYGVENVVAGQLKPGQQLRLQGVAALERFLDPPIAAAAMDDNLL